MTEWEYFGPEQPDQHGWYLTEGLINIWWNPKLAERDFKDPPTLSDNVQRWLAEHPQVMCNLDPIIGPPLWRFPTQELREEFKQLFMETPERMEEIIEDGRRERAAEDKARWIEQGRKRDEKGRPIASKNFGPLDGILTYYVSMDPNYEKEEASE